MIKIIRKKTKEDISAEWQKSVFTINSIEKDIHYSSGQWYCNACYLLFEGEDFAMYWTRKGDYEVHCNYCDTKMTTGTKEYFETLFILEK